MQFRHNGPLLWLQVIRTFLPGFLKRKFRFTSNVRNIRRFFHCVLKPNHHSFKNFGGKESITDRELPLLAIIGVPRRFRESYHDYSKWLKDK